MKNLIRAVLVTALIGGVAAIAPSPAFAHPSVCVGTGEAQTVPLGYPVLFGPTTGGFSLTIGAGGGVGGCVDLSLTVGPLTAAGTLTGNCGQSTGSGTLTDNGGSHNFTYVSAGSLLVVSGTTITTTITTTTTTTITTTVGVANATPIPNAGGGPNSCLQGNANTFQVTGTVENT